MYLVVFTGPITPALVRVKGQRVCILGTKASSAGDPLVLQEEEERKGEYFLGIASYLQESIENQ